MCPRGDDGDVRVLLVNEIRIVVMTYSRTAGQVQTGRLGEIQGHG